MKRLLVFLAVFLPGIALVYFLSGGSLFPRPSDGADPDATGGGAALAAGSDAEFPDEAGVDSEIRLGGSPTVKGLSAVDFDLRTYREVLDPKTARQRFLRSVDFHGDRSESIDDREIAVRNPRITFHQILDPFAEDKAKATRPFVVVTATRGTLEPRGVDGAARRDQDYDLCRLEGDVRVVALAEGAVMTTPSLECFFDERLVRTSAPVTLDHGTSRLVGTGLEAATLEGLWSILADATLVATDPKTGDDAVVIAPHGFTFRSARAEGDAAGAGEPAAPPKLEKGGVARAAGGVRLELWAGERGSSLEPRFEAESESAEATLEWADAARGDEKKNDDEKDKKKSDDETSPVSAVSLSRLALRGGVTFSDAIGVAGRGGALTLDRGRDELVIADSPVIEIDAREGFVPPALTAGRAPSGGGIEKLVLEAKDEAIVEGGTKGGSPRSLRLRGEASVRPVGDRATTGGGLSGDEIEITFDPSAKPKKDGERSAPIEVRDVAAFGHAALEIPGAGKLSGPEIRLGAATAPDASANDAVYEVVVPSNAELRIASKGLLTESLPGAIRSAPGDGAEKDDEAPGFVVVRSKGPLEYLAPRAHAPGRLRLAQGAEIEEWRGETRTFRMTARNLEAILAAADPGGGALRIASLVAQGRVLVEAPRGRVQARRLEFEASERRIACEGEPAEIETIGEKTGATIDRVRAERIVYVDSLRLVEATGDVEIARLEAPAGDAAAHDFRSRLAPGGAAGPSTLRCGKFRALLALVETNTPGQPRPEAPALEFEDVLAEIGVEVESGGALATGETLTLARRGAEIVLAGRGDRPARLERPSPDDPQRRETVTGPRLVIEPATSPGDPEVATLPDGGDIVLWRARSGDPFSVARVRDRSKPPPVAEPPAKGLVRTAVSTDAPIRLVAGNEIVISGPVRIDQTDEAGAFVSRIEGDALRLELAPASEAGGETPEAAMGAVVSATLTGHVRFDTPQAKGTGGLLVYEARKGRLLLQRPESGGPATLKFARGLDLSARLIEYDLESGEPMLHDFDMDDIRGSRTPK